MMMMMMMMVMMMMMMMKMSTPAQKNGTYQMTEKPFTDNVLRFPVEDFNLGISPNLIWPFTSPPLQGPAITRCRNHLGF